jgi:hypothetical protein
MRDRRPRITFGMAGMRVMRTRQVRKWRPILAEGRRVHGALRARLVGVMMVAGDEAVPGGIVMFLAFEVSQFVLRFLRHGPDSAA